MLLVYEPFGDEHGRADHGRIPHRCLDPQPAGRYQAAGINTYVGLWRGPTDEQLRMLKEANMRVICSQNSFALSNRDNPLIIGWMHGDEPDNAQARPGGKGYGPPILPQTIVSNYYRIQSKDPSRPILLNLGQGSRFFAARTDDRSAAAYERQFTR